MPVTRCPNYVSADAYLIGTGSSCGTLNRRPQSKHLSHVTRLSPLMRGTWAIFELSQYGQYVGGRAGVPIGFLLEALALDEEPAPAGGSGKVGPDYHRWQEAPKDSCDRAALRLPHLRPPALELRLQDPLRHEPGEPFIGTAPAEQPFTIELQHDLPRRASPGVVKEQADHRLAFAGHAPQFRAGTSSGLRDRHPPGRKPSTRRAALSTSPLVRLEDVEVDFRGFC